MWSGHALGGSLPQNFGKLGIRSLATVLTTCLPKFLSALCTIFLWIGGSQESKSSSYVHECWLSVLATELYILRELGPWRSVYGAKMTPPLIPSQRAAAYCTHTEVIRGTDHSSFAPNLARIRKYMNSLSYNAP